MIIITVYKKNQDIYTGFRCTGHAGYAGYGEDIVCAAVSILVINTLNSIDSFTGDTYSLQQDEKTGLIDCRFHTAVGRDTVLLMDSMLLGLEGIRKQYGKKYIRINQEV